MYSKHRARAVHGLPAVERETIVPSIAISELQIVRVFDELAEPLLPTVRLPLPEHGASETIFIGCEA